MTAASEHAAPDRERAETYLRLLAEAELRRALAMPEYKPPRERMLGQLVGLLARRRLMRRRRALVQRAMQQQGAGSVSAGNQNSHASQSVPLARAIAAPAVIRQAARSLHSARTAVAAPAATMLSAAARATSQFGARAQEATWRLRRQFSRRFLRRRRGYEPPPAEACLERVETLAGVFAAVGAIASRTEEDVVGGLRAALAARGRIEQDALLDYHTFGGVAVQSPSGPGGHPMRRMASGTAAPAGPPRTIPVGASASGEIEGVRVRFYLGVLVFDRSGVTLTVHVRFPAELQEQDHGHMDPVYDALNQISAVDDRSATYRADFSGGGGSAEWYGRLRMSPAPPPGVRWLDMTLPGAPPCRLRLDAPPRDLRIITEPATTGAADHFLDDDTIQLLCSEPADLRWVSDGDCDQPPLFQIAGHFVAAGVLGTDSPSVRRLAAAAARLGAQLPESLAGIEPTDLPADWLSTVSRAGCTDGPTSAIPIAVVLPEVDGVQCVLGDLVSEDDMASMQVYARGWPEPRHPRGTRNEQIWWSARDNLGGRYFVGEGGWNDHNGETDLDLEITPAINPQARALDIILTGPTTQVTVSVPLDWQEAL